MMEKGLHILSKPLHQLVSEKNLIYIPLRSDSQTQNAEKNIRWHIFVNEKVEFNI